jgi:hypothetical protein
VGEREGSNALHFMAEILAFMGETILLKVSFPAGAARVKTQKQGAGMLTKNRLKRFSDIQPVHSERSG